MECTIAELDKKMKPAFTRALEVGMGLEDDKVWEELLTTTRQEVDRRLAQLTEQLGKRYDRVQLLIIIQNMIPQLTATFLQSPEGKQCSLAEFALMQQVLQETLEKMIREASN